MKNIYDFEKFSSTDKTTDRLNARIFSLFIGISLSIAAIFLVSTSSSALPLKIEPVGSQRNMANFLAGMFGFTAIEALRRSSR
jgi:hypothetical protein